MRTYISATGYGIDVGESASENDELTFSADPEYRWFHVSWVPEPTWSRALERSTARLGETPRYSPYTTVRRPMM